MPSHPPPPTARLVGRPRFGAFAFAIALVAGSVAAFADASVDGFLAGLGMLAAGLICFAVLVRVRVWVDGDLLYARKFGGWDHPVRLDRLKQADHSAQRHLVELYDSDGHGMKLDPWSVRLTPLYAVLAGYVAPNDPVANEKLQRRITRFGRAASPRTSPHA